MSVVSAELNRSVFLNRVTSDTSCFDTVVNAYSYSCGFGMEGLQQYFISGGFLFINYGTLLQYRPLNL